MAAEGFWIAIAKNATKVGTVVGLGGIAIAVVGFAITRGLAPSAVPAQLSAGSIGIVLVFVAGLLHAIRNFPEVKRAGLVERTFYVALVFVLIFVGITYYFLSQTNEHAINVYLRQNGQLLATTFSMTYSLPGRGQQEIQGENGHAVILGVPSTLEAVRVDAVRINGYEPAGGPDYKIENASINVAVKKTGPPIPLSIGDFPDPGPYVPPKELLAAPPVHEPDDVLFTFVNRTGDDLELALYNCTLHYRQDVPVSDRMTRWIIRPFPANNPQQIFNNFKKGCGWYVIYALRNERFYRLGVHNLFQVLNPLLVVTRSDNADQPYIGEFSGS